MPKERMSTLVQLAVFGVISGGLYVMLYMFEDDLTRASERVRNGEMIFAGVPVAVAFAFSFAHGKFTSHFWDSLGFQAKKKH
jgi:hypothetical protein